MGELGAVAVVSLWVGFGATLVAAVKAFAEGKVRELLLFTTVASGLLFNGTAFTWGIPQSPVLSVIQLATLIGVALSLIASFLVQRWPTLARMTVAATGTLALLNTGLTLWLH